MTMAILDSQGRKVQVMPNWHKDVSPDCLVNWCGHWFEFAGIDSDKDTDVVFFRYKEPTHKTKLKMTKSAKRRKKK